MATNGSGWRLLVGSTTIADKIICETSSSLEMRVSQNEQFNRSKDAEMAIELGMYENDYKSQRRMIYEDLFDFGVAGFADWLGDEEELFARWGQRLSMAVG